ncbi:MAG TPA: arsenite methyltransferase [Solirubrobacteraceae bacterium]|jgi:SAM-dependent methyltransferase
MAELTDLTLPSEPPACCALEAHLTCCEPSEKAECCAPESSGCGCGAGSVAETDVREAVRARYAAAATGAKGSDATTRTTDERGVEVWGAALYDEEAADAPEAAIAASLGCGVPTAVADLHEGETVLDLGSGAGADVLISARRVGPAGKAIGIDMTDEMLELARSNAQEAGLGNVEFVKGYLEELPLADSSVDIVISNCVINLAADKTIVLREAARVLRPGGRLAISDVITDADLDQTIRADVAAWTGCIAGALRPQTDLHGDRRRPRPRGARALRREMGAAVPRDHACLAQRLGVRDAVSGVRSGGPPRRLHHERDRGAQPAATESDQDQGPLPQRRRREETDLPRRPQRSASLDTN